MIDSEADKQRLLELLSGSVLGDLSDEEQTELNQTFDSAAHDSLIWELERTAAAVHLALERDADEALPQSVAARIRADAISWISRDDALFQAVRDHSQPLAGAAEPAKIQAASVSPREWIAWIGLAAAVVLCVGLLFFNGSSSQPVTKAASVARSELLNRAEGVIRANWTAGKTPFENRVDGDVVWDNASQRGFMRFVGMPVNDPKVQQYQLWIIDPARDEEPIDGGVFDVTSANEVIVPIDAKLAVIDPKAFAITIEKPGGVVVSTQERLPLLASVQ